MKCPYGCTEENPRRCALAKHPKSQTYHENYYHKPCECGCHDGPPEEQRDDG